MIKNIIFDLGNVLINYDFELFFEKLGYARAERSLAEADHLIQPFECGELEIMEFINGLSSVYHNDLTIEDFTEAWCDIFWENKPLLAIAEKLKEKYRIMILSNNDELHFPYIWEKYPSLHFFQNEDIMISSRLGYIKPDKGIYVQAAEKHNFNWEESLFIDDKQENILMAENMGARVIWHRVNEITNSELKAI
ncbi:MAG: HAD-IA family hydrolase [Candidatus Cloacimonetes bacterium]|nr:HAD-IA family hydrolase [Candidatus Cloacimonadota bacterium]